MYIYICGKKNVWSLIKTCTLLSNHYIDMGTKVGIKDAFLSTIGGIVKTFNT